MITQLQKPLCAVFQFDAKSCPGGITGAIPANFIGPMLERK
jgi:hypothetical protein